MTPSSITTVDVSRNAMPHQQFYEMVGPLSMELGLRLCAERYAPDHSLRMPQDLPMIYVKTLWGTGRWDVKESSTQLQELAKKVWQEKAHLRPAVAKPT